MKLKDQIKSSMQERPTDELLVIWTANNQAAYSADAFEAIAEVLRNRGVDLPSQRKSEPEDTKAEAVASEIIVTDIRMPFMSMVVFMVKWAIASIPAIFILATLAWGLFELLGVHLGGPFAR
jgi:hypothetical protein